MKDESLLNDNGMGQSSRLIHRLAARELTPAEVAAIGGGRAAVAAACGTVSCSNCCCDDSDMSAA